MSMTVRERIGRFWLERIVEGYFPCSALLPKFVKLGCNPCKEAGLPG
ncbi:unnamed protein product [Acanthoscelides obtectus]|uniref:Uncharacterized protein n=1 Tax=Acanthoscelides obtectus TaxID=200917 RepID=A0A9P0MHY2_ACAOB|nr:unnamed protein product [Acanthoscelides obtectus]CAK1630308.1 hypothetical protein AOBTE_LOCUS6248 [Acanthoscelides obtectus]